MGPNRGPTQIFLGDGAERQVLERLSRDRLTQQPSRISTADDPSVVFDDRYATAIAVRRAGTHLIAATHSDSQHDAKVFTAKARAQNGDRHWGRSAFGKLVAPTG